MNDTFFNIRTRTLTLLGLMFIVMLGALAHFVLTEREDNLAKAMATLQASAERITDKHDDIVNYAQQLVMVLTQTQDLPEFTTTTRCQEFLAQILKQEPRLANIAIAAPNGELLCNGAQPSQRINIADRVYFQKALNSTGLIVDEAIVSRSTGKLGIPFSRAIRDKNGRIQGVLVALIDLQWLGREIGMPEDSTGTRVGLIDDKGTVLARQPDPEKWIGKNASHTPFFKTLIAHGGTGSAEEIGFDQVRRIYGFSHFAETAAGPIYLWVGVAKEPVVASVERKFSWTLAVLLALLVITFGAIWIGDERWVLRPLAAMTKAARRLGQGDYTARTGLRYTADELGQLARSFDEMAVDLLSKNELLRLNRSLKTISSCNKTIVHADDEGHLLREICRHIVEVGNYRMAWVGYAEHDEEKSVRPAAQYGYEDDYLENVRITWADAERGRGPTGTAIRTGVAQPNQDFANNPLLAPWRADAVKRGYQSSIALPLKDPTGVFGALTIYSAECMAFNEPEMQLLEELADDLAFGITALRSSAARKQAEDALRQSEECLRQLNQSLEQRVQKELARNREKDLLLIQQSRMAMMGEMMRSVAHHWRQPLNALNLILGNIKDAYDYGDLNQENLDRLVSDGERMSQKMSSTIDNFRNFFKTSEQKTRFNFEEPIREALNLLDAPLKNERIQVELEIRQEVCVEGWYNELSQALLNVLMNAKDAIKAKDGQGKIVIRLGLENDSGVIRIRDNGGGIPADILPKIFDPYFTTKESCSGIGLYMSRMILNHMNGRIEAHSLEGGTEVVISVPAIH